MAPAATLVDTPVTPANGLKAAKTDQTAASKGDQPTLVRLSDEELASGVTSHDTIQACLEAFHRDGVVVLYNAIPEALIDKLNAKMTEDSIRIQDMQGTHFHQGKNTRNMSVAPPLTEEWIMKEFWANDHVVKITEHILGPKPELVFVRSNSTLPHTTGRQAVHSDVPRDHIHLPFMIIANIFLCEVTPHNGSTELWLGTTRMTGPEHHIEDSGWIKKSSLIERAKVRPPCYGYLPKGSIFIRDPRMWHSGMPNHSSDYRIMLDVIYTPPWWRSHMHPTLPHEVKAHVESFTNIDVSRVVYADIGDDEYLTSPYIVNMTQDRSQTIINDGVNGAKYIDPNRKARAQPATEITPDFYWTPGESD